MAFKPASSPGSYQQLVAPVDNVSKVEAKNQRDRNRQIEHSKKLADTHRAHAQSFKFAVQVEGQARQNALAFDEYVRGVNYQFETQRANQAYDTAIRNAKNEQIESNQNTQQLLNLVGDALGTGAKIWSNHEKAKEAASQKSANEFYQKWNLSFKGWAGLRDITKGMWEDEATLEASVLAAKRAGLKLSDIRNHLDLSSTARASINQNYLSGQLKQLPTLLAADPELTIGGKNYTEWQNSGLPESASMVENLARQKVSQVFRMSGEAGYPVNPNTLHNLVENQVAAAVNKTGRFIEASAVAQHADEQREKTENILNTIGADGYLESLNGQEPDDKKQLTKQFLSSLAEMADMGTVSRTTIEEVGETIIPGTNKTIAEHTAYAGHYQKALAASIQFTNREQTIRRQQVVQDKQEAYEELDRGFLKGKSLEELEALELQFKQNGLWDGQVAGYFEAAVRDIPKNQSEVEMDEMVDTYGAWAPISALEVYGDQAGKYTAKVYKLRNADPWFKGIRDQIKALGQKGLKMTGEAARAEPSYHTVVADLNAMTVGLMEKYLSQPGVTVKQAQGQVEAILLDLEKKIETDPFGDHILGVWDRSEDGAQPGFKRHREVDAIIPLSAPSLRDISEEFATTTKNSTPEQIQEYLSTNPNALSSAISTEDAVQMLNDLHNDKAASRSALKLFANVGRYTGQGPTEAAKTLLKGRGVNYKPPENTTSKEMEKLFDATFLTQEIVTRYGGNNAMYLNSGQAVVRGQVNFSPSNVSSITRENDSGQPGLDVFLEDKKAGAVLPGVVKYIGNQLNADGSGYGLHVVTESPNPLNGQMVDVLYAHAAPNSIRVRVGDRVNVGTHIFTQGGTGSVSSYDGTIFSIDLFKAGPPGTTDMTPAAGWKDLREHIINNTLRGGNQQQPQQPQQQSRDVSADNVEDDPEISGQVMETRGGIKYWWAGDPPEFYVKTPGGKPEKKPAHHFELYAEDT